MITPIRILFRICLWPLIVWMLIGLAPASELTASELTASELTASELTAAQDAGQNSAQDATQDVQDAAQEADAVAEQVEALVKAQGDNQFISGESVTLSADQTHEGTVWITARTAQINGPINGDLFVVAQTVTILGSVDGSIHLICENASLAANCQGSLLAVCRSLVLKEGAAVGGELLVTAETLETQTNSIVAQRTAATAARIDLNGQHLSPVRLNSPSVRLGGEFSEAIDIDTLTASDPATASTTVWVEPQAVLHADLNIRGGGEPQIDPQATMEGQVTRSAAPRPETGTERDWVRQWLIRWAQFVVIGIGLRLVIPTRMKRYVQNGESRPLASAFFGPLYWLLISLGSLLVAVASVSVMLGLQVFGVSEPLPLVIVAGGILVVTMLGGGTLLGAFAGPAVVSVAVIHWIGGWLPGLRRESYVLPLLLGTLAASAAIGIPGYGPFVWLALAVIGSGTFLVRHRSEPPKARSYGAGSRGKPQIQRIR